MNGLIPNMIPHIKVRELWNACTYLFKKNGTLYFFYTIETINHIDLIFSGIHIFPCPHVSCKLGYNIPRNKVTATILVKDTKSGRI